MAYSEVLITPMREDLTRHGILEARTPEKLDEFLQPGSGNVLVVTNSVCGCAAGKARPGVVVALQNSQNKPDKAVTVFAGGDVAAVEHLRNNYLPSVPPSSPSVALFRDGKPVWVMHRYQIESSDPLTIAKNLMAAFDQHCVPQPQ
jgi:putative YphP/YqiW family bacilliredoxin